MKKPDPAILVIFGASGDLTHRKLLPAIFSLFKQGLLADNWALVGVGRTQFSDIEFREMVEKDFGNSDETKGFNQAQKDDFISRLYFTSLDTKNAEEYSALKDKLLEVGSIHSINPNYLFYLSTPPSLYPVIPVCLAKHGLNLEDEGWRRLIVEKPFGYDPKSAQELNSTIREHFKEQQIYRIDHYLGKETVQNMLVFRFSNEIFEPLWSRKFIEYVEITSAESLGVEKRGGYYDQSGAVRDMLQNHLLQVLAMVAMEPPAHFDARAVRNETLKVFQSLRPLDPNTISENLILGQYTSSQVKGKPQAGYREEPGVEDDSRTETYVALKANIDNYRWSGVPFYVRTGKMLPTRVTEVVLHFKKIPNALFGLSPNTQNGNMLILRIQPDEGIQLSFGMKEPGSGFNVKNVTMDFRYKDLSNTHVPSAYERLLLDCILGDATLYARGDAVEACWDYIEPILKYKEQEAQLFGYPAGTWGPIEADQLLEANDYKWRFPCKNLTNDQNYCEL